MTTDGSAKGAVGFAPDDTARSPSGDSLATDGTTAVVGAMLSTLAEALGGFDERLGHLEQAVARALLDSGVTAKEAGALPEAVAEVAERLADVERALGPRLSELEAQGARRLEDLSEGLVQRVDEVGARLVAAQETAQADRDARQPAIALDQLERTMLEAAQGAAHEVADAARDAAQDAAAPLLASLQGMEARLAPLEEARGSAERTEETIAASMGRLESSLADRLAPLPQLVEQSAADAVARAMAQEVAERAVPAVRAVVSTAVDGLGADLRADLEAGVGTLVAEAMERQAAMAASVEAVALRLERTAAEMRTEAEREGTRVADELVRLGDQISSLVAQPGPGPAMAMVAAGLAERFEARTDALVDLLGHLAEGVRPVAARVDALEGHVQGNATRVDRELEVLAKVVERHHDAVGRLAELVDARLAQVEESGRMAAGGADAIAAIAPALDGMREELSTLTTRVHDAGMAQEVVTGVADLVHREAELLAQRVAAVNVALEATRGLLDAHVEETANSLGRRATEMGRRLVSDLGIRGKRSPAEVVHGERRQLHRGSGPPG